MNESMQPEKWQLGQKQPRHSAKNGADLEIANAKILQLEQADTLLKTTAEFETAQAKIRQLEQANTLLRATAEFDTAQAKIRQLGQTNAFLQKTVELASAKFKIHQLEKNSTLMAKRENEAAAASVRPLHSLAAELQATQKTYSDLCRSSANALHVLEQRDGAVQRLILLWEQQYALLAQAQDAILLDQQSRFRGPIGSG